MIIRDARFRSTWRASIANHKRHTHSDEKPFSCNYMGCTFRGKMKGNLKNHQKQVHMKIKTKQCHVCDKRFFWKADLRAHMTSRHQTKDHDVEKCDKCVISLKKNQRLSQAAIASNKRRNERESKNSTPRDACPADRKEQEKLSDDLRRARKRRSGLDGNHAHGDVSSQPVNQSLNDDLVDVHIDMQLLSSA